MPTSSSPYPHLAELLPAKRAAANGQMSRSTSKRAELEELSRFTADSPDTQEKYSPLPNLSSRNYGVDALPDNCRKTTSSAGLRMGPTLRRSATLPASSRRTGTKYIGRPDSTTGGTGASYLGADSGAESGAAAAAAIRATCSAEKTRTGRQTAEQERHFNQPGQVPSSGISWEKDHRSSTWTQWPPRGDTNSRDRDVHLDPDNLHDLIQDTAISKPALNICAGKIYYEIIISL